MAFDDTIVVKFGESVSSSDRSAILEFDDYLNRETVDGVTSVKSSFNPGDECYIRIQLLPG